MEPMITATADQATLPNAAARNVDDVIRDFATAGADLPRASMRWALDHWDMAGPHFVALLTRYAAGADRTESMESVVFFVVHLLAERRETRGFSALCRLLEDAAASESVLGDAITTTLSGVLIGTYDGDAAALKRVVESATADQFVRGAALDAMSYLTRTGVIADQEMRRYLLHLRAEMRPRSPDFVWTAWACSIANLGYADFASEVERLMSRGFIPRTDIGMNGFNRRLQRTLDDPERLAGLKHDRIEPFTDAIGTFSKWYGFSEQYKSNQAARAARRERKVLLEGPRVDPMRRVGRNDPCPCGSGKKHKKCCLQ